MGEREGTGGDGGTTEGQTQVCSADSPATRER
jgi:hypothetical protein